MTLDIALNPAGGGKLQWRRTKSGSWTAAMEETFLANLAVTANVTASLALVQKSPRSLYYRRRTRPDFALRWDRALSEATILLEAEMMARALNPGDIVPAVADVAIAPMTDQTRIQLMTRHEKRVAAYRERADVRRADTALLRKKLVERITRLARSLGLEVPA